MIEKFNFYDVYGYLVPGLVVVGLLFIPFGLFLHKWPTADFGSAILSLVFAYILGHVIQITVLGIIHPKIKDPFGKTRFPSDIFLDAESLLSTRLKAKIAQRCQELFEIDISAGKDPGNTTDTKEMNRISRDRGEAFFRARSALGRAANKGYGEQFQGLYAMLGGIVIGLGIAGCYFLGWAAAFWGYSCFAKYPIGIIGMEIILMAVAAAFAIQSRSNEIKKDRTQDRDIRIRAQDAKKAWEKALAVVLALASLWAGVLVGCRTLTGARSDAPHDDLAWIMMLLTMGTVIAAVRLYGAYRAFAKEFAVTVWRDFGDMAKDPPQQH